MLGTLLSLIYDHWKVCAFLYVLQGLLGVYLFERAWKKTERVRLGEEALWAELPSFRRLDSHKWSRWVFYPGCFLILVPRMLWIASWLFSIGLWTLFLYRGRTMDEPLTGWRREAHKWVLRIMVSCMMFGFGYRCVHVEHTEADYSKYLGPDWRDNKFKGKNVSTLVINHLGFLDIPGIVISLGPKSFLSAEDTSKMPLARSYCEALQCLYVNRDAGKEHLDRLVDEITERQHLLENTDKEWNQLVIFAEAGVTNGKNMSRFRRGAFTSGVAVQPGYLKVDFDAVNPDYCNLRNPELFTLSLSEFALNKQVYHTFPVFVPNEYLYTEYAKTIPGHETMGRPDIYAHAVNEFLREAGGFGLNTNPNRDMVNLRRFVGGRTNEITVNGKTFYWPPRHATSSSEHPKTE